MPFVLVSEIQEYYYLTNCVSYIWFIYRENRTGDKRTTNYTVNRLWLAKQILLKTTFIVLLLWLFFTILAIMTYSRSHSYGSLICAIKRKIFHWFFT